MCELGKRLTAVQSWISRGLREAFLAAVLWVKRPPLHLQLGVVGGLAARAPPRSLWVMKNHGLSPTELESSF